MYTKYKGEKMITKYAKKYNYNYAILRYFNIAGASSSNKIGEINSSHGHLFKNIAIQSLKKPVMNVYEIITKLKMGRVYEITCMFQTYRGSCKSLKIFKRKIEFYNLIVAMEEDILFWKY